MDIDLTRSAEQFHNRHRRDRIWKKLVSVLCCVVVFCTTYALILPAITMEREPVCGLAEHQHGEGCYTKQVVKQLVCSAEDIGLHTHGSGCSDGSCGYADFVIHEHDASCYDGSGALVCTLPQVKEHAHLSDCYRIPQIVIGQHDHTDACYSMQHAELLCALAESDGHTHTEGCMSQISKLVCEQEEGETHTHAETCYRMESVLSCGKEEMQAHHHTDDCYRWERRLSCGKEEGPIYGSGEPELICTKKEVKAHSHTAQCFDPAGKWICGQLQILGHTHSTGCFDTTKTKEVLTCDLEVHIHNEECYSDSLLPAKLSAASSTGNQAEETKLLSNSEAPQTGIDLGQYITAATVSKLENGNWVTSSEFRDGDQVNVVLSYALPAGQITSSCRLAHYQLPDGIRPNQQVGGSVYHDGRYAGIFTINTDGLIQIEYDQSFASGEPFTGSLEFSGTLSAADDNTSTTVQFGGNGGTITIEPIPESERKDISVSKSGTPSTSHPNKIDYTVTISTTAGTKEAVSFDDWLNGNGSFDRIDGKIDIRVVRVDTAGKREQVSDITLSIQEDRHVQIPSLPALEAGESYEITYSATAIPNTDGYCALNNMATANGQSKWNSVTVSNTRVAKDGKYDEKTGKINWTIHIDNCADYILSDSILVSDGSTVPLPETVTLKDANGTESSVSLPYKFPDSGSYTVTYQTDAPDAEGTVKVTNTARVKKDDIEYEATKEVEVTKRNWAVQKAWNSETVSDGQRQYLWTMKVTIPPGSLTGFTYTDTIQNSAGGSWHYAIASQLQEVIESRLRLERTDGSNLTYSNDSVSFDVTYYDAENNPVQSTDSETHVQSFTIKVTPNEGVTIDNPYSLVLEGYPTIADISGMNAGEERVFSNTGAVGNVTVTASHSYSKPMPLEKRAVYEQYGLHSTHSSITVDYTGILRYRIILNIDASQNGEITFYDILPPGTEYVVGSVAGSFYNHDYHMPSYKTFYDSSGPHVYDFAADQKPTVVQCEGNKLQISIQGGYNDDGQTTKIAIDYQISIAGDPGWKTVSGTGKVYTNSVSWNGTDIADSQTTTVNREIKRLSKTAEQLKDSNNQPINVMEYTVVINPVGEDLNPGEDRLTLIDTLTVSSVSAGAYLDLENTKLYPYADYVAGRRDAVDIGQYSLNYDEINHILTVDLPDEFACVLVYRYNIDRGSADSLKLSNNVSLSGEYASITDKQLEKASASAAVVKSKLTIYKVNAGDFSERLAGATFKLEGWNQDRRNWETVNTTSDNTNGEYSTNDEGELIFASDAYQTLRRATLYRLCEIKAPAGYALSSTPYYFAFMNEARAGKTAMESTLEDMTGVFAAEGSNVPQADVHFYPFDREAIGYIPNTRAYVLPETGGIGTQAYTLGGFTLTTGAVLWLCFRRKRRREDG